MDRFRQAWQSTKEYWKTNIVLPFLFGAGGFVFRWKQANWGIAMSEIMSYLAWTLIPAVAVGFLILLWNYLNAPYKLCLKDLSKERERIKELEKALADKEKQLGEVAKLKNGLRIGAKVNKINTAGYYDRAFGRQSEGDRQVTLDVILAPAKVMTLDIVALELWGKRFEAKIQRDVAPFDLIKLTPLTLTDARTYTLVFDVPKELAIDTQEARIYALANSLEYLSEPFAINFSEVYYGTR